MAGRVVAGRYELEAAIGGRAGAMLYRALDRQSGEPVAIKLLSPLAPRGNEALARRLLEFRLLKNLQHPHALRVLETGLAEDASAYVAMELLHGEPLSESVHRLGPMPPAEVADVLDQLASVLDAAHDAGIIHRSIKPKNLFMTRDEADQPSLRLLGFDSAKIAATERENASGQLPFRGTPAYMSPEQALGRNVTRLSDVYSTGVTVFALLTGQLPFDESTDTRMLQAHARVPAPRLRDRAPFCPVGDELEEVVLRAMAKEPADRMRTVGEFARAFRAALPSETELGAAEELEHRTVSSIVPVRGLVTAVFVLAAGIGILVGTLVSAAR